MILSASLLGLLWATALARLPTLWRDRRQQALWGAVACVALAKTASFPPVAARLDAPELPHLLGVISAFCLLRFVGLVTGTGSVRRDFAVTAGTLLVLTVLAAAAGGIHGGPETIVPGMPGAQVGYWLVLEGYLGAVLITGTVLFASVGPSAPAGLPRAGLCAIADGLTIVSLYAVSKALLVLATACGVRVHFAGYDAVAHPVQAAAILVAVAGAVLPAARRAREAAAAYRSLLVLRPLWTAMRDAFPQVILFTPRRAVIELAGVDDVHLRLYRRVIEIRDGMLALREHLPAGGHDLADPAEAEARDLVTALHRRASGSNPPERPGSWAAVGPEMADEVAWLSRVSVAYRRISGGGARPPRPF